MAVLGVTVDAMPPADLWWWSGTVFAALLGHVFSPWIGFKGGKGVATGFGAMVAMWPVLTWPVLLALAAWLASLKATRIVSLSSMVAGCSLPLWCAITLPWPAVGAVGSPWRPMAVTGGLALAVLLTHRANIRRLLAGTEPRVGAKRVETPATIAP
jgi:glycerol-3-phosphate acyltransferase PlsY